MELNIRNGGLLLLIAAVVAILTRRLRLPYSVGLVAAGIAMALLPFAPVIGLTKDLLFTSLLPSLVFEAAFNLRWDQLRRDSQVVILLATLGVVLSAAVTALGMYLLVGWHWIGAVIFGILIAATDPVSVIATFREARVHGRLLLLVESESLFNDGTAAVLFAIALEIATGGGFTLPRALLTLLVSTGGSLLCGAVVAGAALLLSGRTEDHLVEIVFTIIAAYGSSLLAERFHFSGVLATLTAGILMGNLGPLGAITSRGREAVQSFWELAAFIANSFVFLLIGMHEAGQQFLARWPAVVAAIVIVTLARAAAVYPSCALVSRSSLRVSMRHQHILFWGGLRGALALALALALPSSVPERETIVTASFAVVAFSIFAQGLTLSPLLRRFGEIPGTKPLASPAN